MGSFQYPKLLAEMARTQWAITQPALDGLIAALRHELSPEDYSAFHGASVEQHQALSAIIGSSVPDTRLSYVSGNVGSIVINGPIVPRASAFLEASGLVSIDRLTSEFKAMEADSEVETILLVLDSPGGDITGVSEFASLVARCNKKTAAYAYGMAASAAYWISSAVDVYYAADTALVGSIGVVSTVSIEQDDSVVTLTNTQSPRKREDYSTEAAQKNYVHILDQLADVFIDTVAANRDVPRETVISKFGKGDVLGSAEALEVGAIDGIEPLQLFMDRLAQEDNNMESKVTARAAQVSDSHVINGEHGNGKKEQQMPNLNDLVAENAGVKAEIATMTAAAREEGVQKTQADYAARLKAVKPVLEGSGYPESIKALAFGVLEGTEELAALKGAMIAIDAIKAQKEEAAAVQDSAEIEPTPASKPDQLALSTDGVLRTSVDMDAEIEFLRSEVR